jgi:hypothetical protein
MTQGVEIVQATPGDSLLITGRFYLRQVCVSYTQVGDTQVVVDIYDRTTAPAGGDTPHCQVPAVGRGVNTIPVPDPGMLFLNGAFVSVPANTTLILFFERA